MNHKEYAIISAKAYELYLKGQSNKQIAVALGVILEDVEKLIDAGRTKDPIYKKFSFKKNEEKDYRAIFKEIEENEQNYLKRLPKTIKINYQNYKKLKIVLKEYLARESQISFQSLAIKYELSLSNVTKVLAGKHPVFSLDMFLNSEEIKKIQAYSEEKRQNRSRNLKYCANLFATMTVTEKETLTKFREDIEFWIHMVLEYRLNLESLKQLVSFQLGNSLLNELVSFQDHTYSNALYFLFSSQFRSTKLKENDLEGAQKILKTKTKSELLQAFLLKDYYALHLLRKQTKLTPIEEQEIFKYKLKYVSFDLKNEADIKLIEKYGDSNLMINLKRWESSCDELKARYVSIMKYYSNLTRTKKSI